MYQWCPLWLAVGPVARVQIKVSSTLEVAVVILRPDDALWAFSCAMKHFPVIHDSPKCITL